MLQEMNMWEEHHGVYIDSTPSLVQYSFVFSLAKVALLLPYGWPYICLLSITFSPAKEAGTLDHPPETPPPSSGKKIVYRPKVSKLTLLSYLFSYVNPYQMRIEKM